MELDANILSSISLQETDRLITIIGDLGIRPVMADTDVVLAGELGCLSEEIDIGYCPGRVIRIIYRRLGIK